jgi:hypothetical protein
MSGMSANLCSFRAFFNFGKSQKCTGLSQVNKVMVHFYNNFLGPELANSVTLHFRGTVMVENPLVRPVFGSFSLNRFQ